MRYVSPHRRIYEDPARAFFKLERTLRVNSTFTVKMNFDPMKRIVYG